jgi:hypothetical protein
MFWLVYVQKDEVTSLKKKIQHLNTADIKNEILKLLMIAHILPIQKTIDTLSLNI